jgi:inositol hexakisphosphate/diphosphoinositol-pentakisphosphate kinase
LKQVLELYGHFSGINRKIQLKYLPKGPPKKSNSEDGKATSKTAKINNFLQKPTISPVNPPYS